MLLNPNVAVLFSSFKQPKYTCTDADCILEQVIGHFAVAYACVFFFQESQRELLFPCTKRVVTLLVTAWTNLAPSAQKDCTLVALILAALAGGTIFLRARG